MDLITIGLHYITYRWIGPFTERRRGWETRKLDGTRPTRPRPTLSATATASAASTTRLRVGSAAQAAVAAKVQATAVGVAAPTVSGNDSSDI